MVIGYVFCEFCNKRCSKNSNLMTHIDTQHKGLRFLCPERECSFVTTTKNLLVVHLSTVHPSFDSRIPHVRVDKDLLKQFAKDIGKAESIKTQLESELEERFRKVDWKEEDKIILENIKKKQP